MSVATRAPRSFLELLPNPAFEWTREDGEIVLRRSNEAGVAYTRGKVEGLLGRPASVLYADMPDVPEAMEEALRTGTTVTRAGPYALRTTGEFRELRLTFIPTSSDTLTVYVDDYTDARMAERRAQRLSHLVHRTRQGVVLATGDGRLAGARIVYVNPAFGRMVGRTPDNLVGHRVAAIARLFGTRGYEQIAAVDLGAPSSEASFDVRIQREGKRPLWMDVECFRIQESEEYRNMLALLLTDVTADRAERERLEALVQGSPDGVVVHRRGTVVLANPAASELLTGDATIRLDGRQMREFFREEERSRAIRNKELIEAGEPSEPREYTLVRADGTLLPVEIYSRLILFDRQDAILSQVRDLGPRRRILAALRDSEARLADAQSLAQLGSWEWAMGDEGAVWSDEVYRILGLDLAAKPTLEAYLERIHPDDRHGLATAVQETLDGARDGYFLRHRVVRPDGGVRYVECRGAARREGSRVALHGTLQDVTELKVAQETADASRRSLQALTAHLQTVREEERRRVARDVHDELGQAWTVMKMDLASLRSALPEDHLAQRRIESMNALATRAMAECRRIAESLRPVVLDDVGLSAAVEDLIESLQGRSDPELAYRSKGNVDDLPDEVVSNAYRIVQEALTNAIRHAHARRVSVTLERMNETLRIVVHDDGVGIEASSPSDNSLGILGMRERAASLGGSLTIGSRFGGGTAVQALLPVESGRHR